MVLLEDAWAIAVSVKVTRASPPEALIGKDGYGATLPTFGAEKLSMRGFRLEHFWFRWNRSERRHCEEASPTKQSRANGTLRVAGLLRCHENRSSVWSKRPLSQLCASPHLRA